METLSVSKRFADLNYRKPLTAQDVLFTIPYQKLWKLWFQNWERETHRLHGDFNGTCFYKGTISYKCTIWNYHSAEYECYSFIFIVPCIADKIYLIIVERDPTLISLFIILQVHSTCFGYQTHPSSGVHKTSTTASATGHMFVLLPPSRMASTGGCSYGFVYSWWWLWFAPETCRLNLQNNK